MDTPTQLNLLRLNVARIKTANAELRGEVARLERTITELLALSCVKDCAHRLQHQQCQNGQPCQQECNGKGEQSAIEPSSSTVPAPQSPLLLPDGPLPGP